MMKMVILRTYKCNSLDCFDSNMCLTHYSRHGAMMKMVILRTYKCNSLHCFDSNVCLPYYSCHVAMMNVMILRTYKCNSLHCFDSNVFNDVYDVIQHYVHLSIIRRRIVACRKRPLDRKFSGDFVNFDMILRLKKLN